MMKVSRVNVKYLLILVSQFMW